MKRPSGLTLVGLFGLGIILAACNGATTSGGSTTYRPPETSAPPPTGEVIGQGNVRVAMLLPLTANGEVANVAVQFRNTAQLAIEEAEAAMAAASGERNESATSQPGISLIIKDTGGTAEGAVEATRSAIAEQAELILGPVFGAEVGPAGQIARSANIPIIAYSTNSAVARPGVYLLSFMPRQNIQHIISYAAAQGRRSFAALLPRTDYGQVVEALFRQAVADAGGRVVSIETYDANDDDVKRAAQTIAQAGNQIDAILMPDATGTAANLASVLRAQGVGPDRVAYLGSGRWITSGGITNRSLNGAWYPAPDNTGFENFAAKYQARFQAKPNRLATLPYDSVRVAIALTVSGGIDRFSNRSLTDKIGFRGTDGIFRLKQNGYSERGLAVYKVGPNGSTIVSQAPTTFEGGF